MEKDEYFGSVDEGGRWFRICPSGLLKNPSLFFKRRIDAVVLPVVLFEEVMVCQDCGLMAGKQSVQVGGAVGT